MKRLSLSLAVLLLSVLLSSCSEGLQKYHQDFYVFGTLMGITVRAQDEDRAQEAFSALQSRFQQMHSDWHAWEPGLLTSINEAFRNGQPVEGNGEIVEMIRQSQRLETASDGRFNPAIGQLIALWGFHTSDYPIIGPPPSAGEIEAVTSLNPSSLDIQIDGLSLYSKNPAVQLDFGGIAKGYAIDIACAMLRERGIGNAIVNAGGDLRAMGHHGERPWKIAVRAPGGGIIGSLETGADEAIFTSGNYERFRQEEEERYPHILDPRTGWPVSDLSSVTVIAAEGMLADAAATAITVAGLDGWEDVARSLELDQVMLVDESGKVWLTRRMYERIELTPGTETAIVDF